MGKKKLCNIEKEAKLKGYNLTALAVLLGVSTTTIQGYKRNDFKPSAETVRLMRAEGFSEQACLDPAGIPPEKTFN